MAALPLKDLNLIMETENPANSTTFQWSIRNIRRLPRLIHSGKFSLVSGQSQDWYVSIEKDQENLEGTFKFSLTYHAPVDALPIRVSSLSRILKNEGSVLVRGCQNTLVFYGGEKCPLFFSPVKVPESKDDKIVFQCSMTVHGYGLVCSRNLFSDVGDIEKLRNDYLSMLKSEEFKDVKIRIKECVYSAHKCVLKHQAPKFFRTYEEDILNGEFAIMGVEPAMFEVILENIYGRKINQIAIAIEYEVCYSAAVFYQLRSLIKAATKEIMYNMKADNVCEFYMLAEVSNDEEMMKYCETFMRNNLQDLKSNISYNSLCASRPHLTRSIAEPLNVID